MDVADVRHQIDGFPDGGTVVSQVADLVKDRAVRIAVIQDPGRRKSHDAAVALRFFGTVFQRAVPSDIIDCGGGCTAHIESMRQTGPEPFIPPADKIIRNVGKVISAEPDRTFRNAECHRGIIGPISRRRIEGVAAHHFRDMRMSVFGHELDRRTQAVADDQTPEHPFEAVSDIGSMLWVKWFWVFRCVHPYLHIPVSGSDGCRLICQFGKCEPFDLIAEDFIDAAGQFFQPFEPGAAAVGKKRLPVGDQDDRQALFV